MNNQKILTIEKAYNLAIKRLSLRDYSQKEMVKYLQKRLCNQDDIITIIKKLVEYNYINDEKLCRRICLVWQESGAYGKLVLQQKLLKRGFDKQLIENVLSDIKTVDEYAMVEKVFLSYIKKIKTIDKKNIARIWRHMASKGFKYSSIMQVFKNNEQRLLNINNDASLDTYFKNLYN